MKYGLIAGNGQFPFLVLDGARRQGAQISVVAIKEETDRAIDAASDDVTWVGIGQLGKMISHFKSRGVERVIMAGQVKHVQLFSGAIPDMRMVKMLWGLERRNTVSLIGGIARELEKDGIELIDSTLFLKDMLAPAAVITKRGPDEQESKNIRYGLDIAAEIVRLDLGQTIVVRGTACVAIEAMEGTDAAIRRAGDLVSGKLTVVKVAKPDQDMRFDVPVIGLPTVETMIAAGATCLSVSAAKTLIFDRADVINLADRHKIAIVGTEIET
jgi:UDP-2,3-diacylglucosamine hydrolase